MSSVPPRLDDTVPEETVSVADQGSPPDTLWEAEEEPPSIASVRSALRVNASMTAWMTRSFRPGFPFGVSLSPREVMATGEQVKGLREARSCVRESGRNIYISAARFNRFMCVQL